MNIEKVRYMLQKITADLKELNDLPMHCDGYMRICSRSEKLSDVLKEAKAHGSILAYKGEVTAILPSLPEGWTEYGNVQVA